MNENGLHPQSLAAPWQAKIPESVCLVALVIQTKLLCSLLREQSRNTAMLAGSADFRQFSAEVFGSRKCSAVAAPGDFLAQPSDRVAMICLIYVNSVTEPFPHAELVAMLENARRNTARIGVTGSQGNLLHQGVRRSLPPTGLPARHPRGVRLRSGLLFSQPPLACAAGWCIFPSRR